MPEPDELASPPILLRTLSYRDLQKLAKDGGLKASGSKTVLIERLGG